MIKINNTINKKQENFWNHCHFHPTDAIEDAWGKRILDKIAQDKAINTVRMYAMLEDIVYTDESGELCYDFRINDLRLDYMIEKGFDILLSYNFMPECIAKIKTATSSVSKNKTRYKGKLINTSVPVDYKLWEEICYTYTKHIIERYGLDVVSKWHCQCFNEPDIPCFFMSYLPDTDENIKIRAAEYFKMYTAFEKGIRRASDKLCIGGPALAGKPAFLEMFLEYVKENSLQLDFISLHNYGANPEDFTNKTATLTVGNNVRIQKKYEEIIKKHGFSDKEVIVDEWGAATCGYFNREEAPELIFRETEVFSSYFARLIHDFTAQNFMVSKMLICLSGQHEMVEDFSGFRNFFTLNFIKKPIYNAYILASKLCKNILSCDKDNDNIFVVPTKNENGEYSVLLTYCSENFEENLPAVSEAIEFSEDIIGKNVQIFCIDKTTTNPYRLYQKKGITEPTDDDLMELREEGTLKPIFDSVYDGSQNLTLNFTANSVFLVTVK